MSRQRPRAPHPYRSLRVSPGQRHETVPSQDSGAGHTSLFPCTLNRVGRASSGIPHDGEGIGVSTDGRKDAKNTPCLTTKNTHAVHTPALVSAGKNGYGDNRIFQITEYFPMPAVRMPSAVCHPPLWAPPAKVRVSRKWFSERTGYLHVLTPSRQMEISMPSSSDIS